MNTTRTVVYLAGQLVPSPVILTTREIEIDLRCTGYSQVDGLGFCQQRHTADEDACGSDHDD
jgi:hypothetical protein